MDLGPRMLAACRPASSLQLGTLYTACVEAAEHAAHDAPVCICVSGRGCCQVNGRGGRGDSLSECGDKGDRAGVVSLCQSGAGGEDAQGRCAALFQVLSCSHVASPCMCAICLQGSTETEPGFCVHCLAFGAWLGIS